MKSSIYETLLTTLHSRIRKSCRVSVEDSVHPAFSRNLPEHLASLPKVLTLDLQDPGRLCVYDPRSREWLVSSLSEETTRLHPKDWPTIKRDVFNRIHLMVACAKSAAVTEMIAKHGFSDAEHTPIYLLTRWLNSRDIQMKLHAKLLLSMDKASGRFVTTALREALRKHPELYEPYVRDAVLRNDLSHGDRDPFRVLSFIISFQQLMDERVEVEEHFFDVEKPPKKSCKKLQAQMSMLVGAERGSSTSPTSPDRPIESIEDIERMLKSTAHFNTVMRDFSAIYTFHDAVDNKAVIKAFEETQLARGLVDEIVLSDRTEYTDAQLLAIPSFGYKQFSERLTPESTFHQRIGIRFAMWSSPDVLQTVNDVVNEMRNRSRRQFRAALKKIPDDKATAERCKSYMDQWPVDLVASTVDITSPTVASLLTALTSNVTFYFNILGIQDLLRSLPTDDRGNADVSDAFDMVAVFDARNENEYKDTYISMQTPFKTNYFGEAKNLFELSRNLRNAESKQAGPSSPSSSSSSL